MSTDRETNRQRAERLIERLNDLVTKGADADREFAKIATDRSAFNALEQRLDLFEISYRGLLASDMLAAFSEKAPESLDLADLFETVMNSWTEALEDKLLDGPPPVYTDPARNAAEIIRHRGAAWFIRRVLTPA